MNALLRFRKRGHWVGNAFPFHWLSYTQKPITELDKNKRKATVQFRLIISLAKKSKLALKILEISDV